MKYASRGGCDLWVSTLLPYNYLVYLSTSCVGIVTHNKESRTTKQFNKIKSNISINRDAKNNTSLGIKMRPARSRKK